MIGWPSSVRRRDPFEPQFSKIERIDKRIDHSNRIVLVDPVVQTFGKQRRLCASRPLNEALHWPPPNLQWIISCQGFSHSQGRLLPAALEAASVRYRRVSPIAAHAVDRLLSEAIAGSERCQQELLFKPEAV